MVRLIIRDDDCNFFSRPEDLEKVYSSIDEFPISYAVVPVVIDVLGGCPDTKGNLKPRPIGDNKELVDYLTNRFAEGKCDLLMHGLSHEYQFNKNGQKVPEMIWRDKEPDLQHLIYSKKQYLEELFGTTINCFVAPSNHIKRNGIKAVYESGMNFSGIIPIQFQRDISFSSVSNYIKRFWIRATKGFPYPGVLDYKTHKELNACNTVGFDYLKSLFEFCLRTDSPMAINVHYWHIREFPEIYKGFFDFVHYAMDNGAIPSRMRDCL